MPRDDRKVFESCDSIIRRGIRLLSVRGNWRGYFRTMAEDLDRPREFRDFLPNPAEARAATVSDLAEASLEKLLPVA
jgi:hypothetical protein